MSSNFTCNQCGHDYGIPTDCQCGGTTKTIEWLQSQLAAVTRERDAMRAVVEAARDRASDDVAEMQDPDGDISEIECDCDLCVALAALGIREGECDPELAAESGYCQGLCVACGTGHAELEIAIRDLKNKVATYEGQTQSDPCATCSLAKEEIRIASCCADNEEKLRLLWLEYNRCGLCMLDKRCNMELCPNNVRDDMPRKLAVAVEALEKIASSGLHISTAFGHVERIARDALKKLQAEPAADDFPHTVDPYRHKSWKERLE